MKFYDIDPALFCPFPRSIGHQSGFRQIFSITHAPILGFFLRANRGILARRDSIKFNLRRVGRARCSGQWVFSVVHRASEGVGADALTRRRGVVGGVCTPTRKGPRERTPPRASGALPQAAEYCNHADVSRALQRVQPVYRGLPETRELAEHAGLFARVA